MVILGRNRDCVTGALADEIAQPRPDMNIKVAAFTVSEKSSKYNDVSAVAQC